jgi:hypothetical protein
MELLEQLDSLEEFQVLSENASSQGDADEIRTA